MTLAFSILGSGSSGNCTVLRLGAGGEDRHVLVDAGLSPGDTERRLAGLGLGLADLRHVLLTHLDHDHFHRGWIGALDEHDLHFHVHRRHQGHALRAGLPARRLSVFDEEFDLDGGTRVEHALVAHDARGCVAYVVEHGGLRFGHATDLGRITRSLLELFTDLDAMALESNYDPPLQRASRRPAFLKHRIMGGQGHLSNEQALEAVLDVAARCRLRQLALLHLSRQCNDPRIVKRLYARRAPQLLGILTITSQHAPTALLRVGGAVPARAGEQMGLF